MKILTIGIFVLTMQFCSRQIDDTIPMLGTGSGELSDNNQYFDSGRYHVKRLFYKTGELLFESFTDTLTGLALHKLYNNGKTKQEGLFDSQHEFHVGVWKFYSDTGLAKVIDFDSTKQVSYYRAGQIARRRGLKNGRLEIDEVMIDRKIYWKVTDWTEEDAGGGKGKYIFIRRSTGQDSVPANNNVEYWN